MQDRFFFQHRLHLVKFTASTHGLGEHLICLQDALFGRLQDRPGSCDGWKTSAFAEESLSGGLNCDDLAGKFQHLLWSNRQSALDAIIRNLFKILEAHIRHSQLRWQHSRRIGEGWFAEWPNGHRPLSTTWPWNIKPSLLVLWGVCWMFYGPSGNNKGKTTRNPRGAASLGEDLGTGPSGSQSQPSRQQGNYSRQPSHDYLTSLY